MELKEKVQRMLREINLYMTNLTLDRQYIVIDKESKLYGKVLNYEMTFKSGDLYLWEFTRQKNFNFYQLKKEQVKPALDALLDLLIY